MNFGRTSLALQPFGSLICSSSTKISSCILSPLFGDQFHHPPHFFDVWRKFLKPYLERLKSSTCSLTFKGKKLASSHSDHMQDQELPIDFKPLIFEALSKDFPLIFYDLNLLSYLFLALYFNYASSSNIRAHGHG